MKVQVMGTVHTDNVQQQHVVVRYNPVTAVMIIDRTLDVVTLGIVANELMKQFNDALEGIEEQEIVDRIRQAAEEAVQ